MLSLKADGIAHWDAVGSCIKRERERDGNGPVVVQRQVGISPQLK